MAFATIKDHPAHWDPSYRVDAGSVASGDLIMRSKQKRLFIRSFLAETDRNKSLGDRITEAAEAFDVLEKLCPLYGGQE